MAYPVLCSLAQTIHQILNHDEYPISVNGKQQIRSLQQEVDSMQRIVEEFKEEGSSLERRIQDAANNVEDVTEHWMHEHIRSTATDVQYDFRELNMAMQEINSIAEKVELIQQKRLKPYSSSPTTTAAVVRMLQPSPTPTPAVDDRMLQSSPTPTPAAVDGCFPVGLEEQVEKLRGLLLESSKIEYIIPITGVGGIGKTTLARAVFEDEQVVNYFDVRAWTTLSQNYDIENVFEELLFSMGKQVPKRLVKYCDTAEEKLRIIFVAMRYLIVVDDVWTLEAWTDVSKVFDLHNKIDGRRILITTRNEGVVPYSGYSNNGYRMALMDKQLSWSLLKQKLFSSKECPSELEKIGKDIAKGCKGLPLAVMVAARILSQTNQTRSSWEYVAENIRSLIVEDAQFQKIMSVSYTHLPHSLRPSFLCQVTDG